MSSQKKKVTLYFNAGMLAETQKEALRQDRSVSWIIQAAWKLAREEVRQTPGVLPASHQGLKGKGPEAARTAIDDAMDAGIEEPTPPPAPAPRPVSRV